MDPYPINLISVTLPILNPIVTSIPIDAIPFEKAKAPLFTLQQTEEDRFLFELYKRGIINEQGRILVDLTKLALPDNNEEQLESLKSLLSREFFVEVGDKDTFLHYLFTALTAAKIIDNEGNLLEELPIDPEKRVTIGKKSLPLHQAIQVLMERGVLSSEGKLAFKPEAEKINLLTDAALDFTPNLWKYLNKDDIVLQIGATNYCCCYTSKLNLYRQIFLKIDRFDPPLNCEVFLFGGRARRRLLESIKYSETAFQHLFKFLNQTNIENFIPAKKLPSNTNDSHEVPDDDIKFLLSNSTVADLYKCTYSLVELFYNRFYNGIGDQKGWLKDNLFTKLNVKTFEGDQFSIAALGKHKNQQIEFLFFKTITREAVFTDEVQELLTKTIENNRPSSFVSGKKMEGWQALVDNVGDIFHLDKPEEISVHLFYMVITRLIRGKLFCSDAQLPFILDHTLEMKNYGGIVKEFQSKNLTYLIADVCKTNINHHHPFALPYAPLAYAYTACNFLKQRLSDQDLNSVFSSIFETYPLAELEGTTFPLLQNLANAIKHEIPFSVISAAINFAGLLRVGFCHTNDSDSLKIKIREIDGSPILHFELTNSFEHKVSIWNSSSSSCDALFTFFEDLNVPENHLKILESLIEEILVKSYSENTTSPLLVSYNEIRTVDTSSVLEQAIILLKSPKNRVSRFFGYCTLLTLNLNEGHDQYIPELIYHFADIFTYRKNSTIKTMLYDQLISVIEKSKYSAAKQQFEEFFQANLKQKDSKQILGSWIHALANTGEQLFYVTALDLWKKYSQHFEKIYEDTTLLLCKSLLNTNLQGSLEILKHTQENQRLSFEAEMEVITELLNAFKLTAKGTVLLNLSKILNSLFDREHPKNISGELKQKFMREFILHVRSLIKEKYFQESMSLLVHGEMQNKIYNYVGEVVSLWHELSQNVITTSTNGFSDDLADLVVNTQRWTQWKIEEQHADMWLKLCHTMCTHNYFSEATTVWEKLCTFSFTNSKELWKSNSENMIDLLTNIEASPIQLKTGFSFLQLSNNLDYTLWSFCFGQTQASEDSGLAEHAWLSFNSLISKHKAETSQEAAHCWTNAIMLMPMLSKSKHVEIYNEAINPKSKLSLAFNDPELLEHKILTWKLITMCLLMNFKEKNPDILNEQIAKLRQCLPNYKMVKPANLKAILNYDHEIQLCILQNERYKEISQILSPQIEELLDSQIELYIHRNERNELTQTIKNIFITTLNIIYKRIDFTNKNLFEDARKIFCSCYTKKRFGFSDFGHHFGDYLISHINYFNNNKIDRKMCFMTVLRDIYLLSHNQKLEKSCYEKCIELLVQMTQTDEKFLKDDFNILLLVLFYTLNVNLCNANQMSDEFDLDEIEQMGNFYLPHDEFKVLDGITTYLDHSSKMYFIVDIKSNIGIPTLRYSNKFPNDNQFIAFKAQFFNYFTFLIDNLVTNINNNPKFFNFIYSFVHQNLNNLINQYPDEKQKLSALIFRFTVVTQIKNVAFFEKHANNSYFLLQNAIKQGIYKDHPELLIEALCYILKSNQIPKDLLMNQQYHENAYYAIHRLLSIKSQDSAVLSVIAFQQFYDTFKLHLDKVRLHNEFINLAKLNGPYLFTKAPYNNVKIDGIKDGQFNFFSNISNLFFTIPPILDTWLDFFKIAFDEYKKISDNKKNKLSTQMECFESFFTVFNKGTVSELINVQSASPEETLKLCDKYYLFLNSIFPDVIKMILNFENSVNLLNLMPLLIFLQIKKTPPQTAQNINVLKKSTFENFIKNISINKPKKLQFIANEILKFYKTNNAKLSLNLNISEVEETIKKHLLKK